jgi:hypothetical protein
VKCTIASPKNPLETFLTLKAKEPVNAVQHAPMATLRFFAENLPPDVVGRIIPEKPDVAANKGEALPTKRGRHVHTAKVGTWFITTEHRRLGNKPERHLAWIVQLANDHFDELKRRIPGIKADLSLLVHDSRFDLRVLPMDLLQKAVEVGELEIEVPPRGEDIILNVGNLTSELSRR